MRINPRKIIIAYNKGVSIPRIVQEYGVSQATVYRWLKRSRSPYTRKPSSQGLIRKSTAPRTTRRILSTQERIDIEELWLHYEYDVRKIVHILKLSCSHMTVYRFLKRKGYIKDKGNYRRPYFQETTHMHARNVTTLGYLQMDVKYITPELSGLPWTCFEYAIIDIHSRYKDIEMIPRLPFTPIFIQTDNGLEFQSKFREFCKVQGLEHHHTHKRSPNENAVIERSFRTDQDEFFYRKKKRPEHYDELREQFSTYLKWYNTERPHFGINLKTPMEVVKEGTT